MSKIVELKLDGDLTQELKVNLAISTEGKAKEVEISGNLPPAPQLQQIYLDWQYNYRSLGSTNRISIKQVTYNGSIQKNKSECHRLAVRLKKELNDWLNAPQFQPLWRKWLEKVNTAETVRILIRTTNQQLRLLPWHLWELLERYPYAEIALAPTEYEILEIKNPNKKQKISILAILGEDSQINVKIDEKLLTEQLKVADIDFIYSPSRHQLNEKLWEKKCDILFFAGHSNTNNGSGSIYINYNETLTLEELSYSLKQAVDNGLKLAIFNSCDGLGLANSLEKLHIPQIIVMRELVPDKVAQEFLKHFLGEFTNNKDLYLAVRQAREKLQGLEDKFPNATWLPTIIQNPAVAPLNWKDFSSPSFINSWLFFYQKTSLMVYLFLFIISFLLIFMHNNKDIITLPHLPEITRKNCEQSYKYYVVQPGDTLAKIADKFYKNGNLWQKIYEANKDLINDETYLEPGWELCIPP